MTSSPKRTAPKRIAFGGVHTESSTFNPVPTPLEAFRILRGAALREHESYSFLDEYDADFLPLLHAAAIPGGPVPRDVYEAFKGEFVTRLMALGPLGGLYLDMHGAMNVSGMDDAEGDFITAARMVVGPDCLVTASYDLHGNVTQRIADAIDIEVPARVREMVADGKLGRKSGAGFYSYD